MEGHWKFRGGGGGGSQRPNLFRGGSKAALVFQTGGAKVKKILCGGSKDNTYIARGRYHTQFPTVLSHCSNETHVQHSQWGIQGRGTGRSPPLF